MHVCVGATLRFIAKDSYNLYINGEFICYGPARAAQSFDEYYLYTWKRKVYLASARGFFTLEGEKGKYQISSKEVRICCQSLKM